MLQEEKSLSIPYSVIPRKNITDKLSDLESKAVDAAHSAYAPYSHFAVGAALLLSNGEIISGSNQENAAYPSGTCAERTAIFYAGSKYPNAAIEALLIVAIADGERVPHISPCGACRQVILEAANRHKPYPVYLAGEDELLCINDCRLLLPFAFDGRDLPD